MATYQIQAGEIGTTFPFSFIDQTTFAPINLTGGTVTLIVTSPQPVKGNPTRSSYECVLSSDGSTATFTGTGVEFSSTGRYSIEAVYENGSAVHHSAVAFVNVLPNL